MFGSLAPPHLTSLCLPRQARRGKARKNKPFGSLPFHLLSFPFLFSTEQSYLRTWRNLQIWGNGDTQGEYRCPRCQFPPRGVGLRHQPSISVTPASKVCRASLYSRVVKWMCFQWPTHVPIHQFLNWLIKLSFINKLLETVCLYILKKQCASIKTRNLLNKQAPIYLLF